MIELSRFSHQSLGASALPDFSVVAAETTYPKESKQFVMDVLRETGIDVYRLNKCLNDDGTWNLEKLNHLEQRFLLDSAVNTRLVVEVIRETLKETFPSYKKGESPLKQLNSLKPEESLYVRENFLKQFAAVLEERAKSGNIFLIELASAARSAASQTLEKWVPLDHTIGYMTHTLERAYKELNAIIDSTLASAGASNVTIIRMELVNIIKGMNQGRTEEEVRCSVKERLYRMHINVEDDKIDRWLDYFNNANEKLLNNYSNILRVANINGALFNATKQFQPSSVIRPQDIKDDIHNQSPQAERSIVELLSNAVDASRVGDPVSVKFLNDGYEVQDYGIGMNPYVILEKLVIPRISGKEGQNTVGRFGIGFYTVLSHLKTGDDSVKVETCFENKKYTLEFKLHERSGEIFVRTKTEDIKDGEVGTKVTVKSEGINIEELTKLASEYFEYNLRNPINLEINEEVKRVNPEPVLKIKTDFGEAYFSENVSDGGVVKILVNGVMIEELPVRGRNVPEVSVINFPTSCKLLESRGKLLFDENAEKSLRRIIKSVKYGDLNESQKLRALNALAEVVPILEGRDKTKTFKHVLDLRYWPRGEKVVPNDASLHFLGLEGIPVHESVYKISPETLPGIEIASGLQAARMIYLASFEPKSELYRVTDNGIYFQKDDYRLLMDNPAAFRTVLGNVSKNTGESIKFVEKSKEAFEIKIKDIVPESVINAIFPSRIYAKESISSVRNMSVGELDKKIDVIRTDAERYSDDPPILLLGLVCKSKPFRDFIENEIVKDDAFLNDDLMTSFSFLIEQDLVDRLLSIYNNIAEEEKNDFLSFALLSGCRGVKISNIRLLATVTSKPPIPQPTDEERMLTFNHAIELYEKHLSKLEPEKRKELIEKINNLIGDNNFRLYGHAAIPKEIRPQIYYLLYGGEILGEKSMDKTLPSYNFASAASFSLIELITKKYNERCMVSFSDDLDKEISTAVAGLDMTVAQRSIRDVVDFQTDNTAVVVSELCQNSRDAIVSHSGTKTAIELACYGGDGLIIECRDYVGMTAEHVLNYLLIPRESDKKDSSELIGRFGQGFFTVLKGAAEVRIKTSLGDGNITYVRITPQIMDRQVVDYQIDMAKDFDPNSDFKGTLIQKKIDSSFPEYEAAVFKSDAVGCIGLLPRQEAEVNFNGEAINQERNKVVEYPIKTRKGIGTIKVYDSANNFLTQHGLTVSNFTDELLENIPQFLRNTHCIVDLPDIIELVKGRNAIAGEDAATLDTYLKEEMPKILFSVYIRDCIYGRQGADFPYDWVESLHTDFLRLSEDERLRIFHDAETLSFGGAVEDLSYYSSPKMRQFLISFVCWIDYPENGTITHKSIFDFIYMEMLPEEKEKVKHIPYWVYSAIYSNNERKKLLDRMRSEIKISEIINFIKDNPNNSAEDLDSFRKKLKNLEGGIEIDPDKFEEKNLTEYKLMHDLITYIAHSTGYNGKILYYFKIDGKLAVTCMDEDKNKRIIKFNLASWDEDIKKLSEAILSEDAYDSKQVQDAIEQFVNTITHEITHVEEESDESTHDSGFRDRQNQIMLRLFRNSEFNLPVFLNDLREKYRTIITQKNVDNFGKAIKELLREESGVTDA